MPVESGHLIRVANFIDARLTERLTRDAQCGIPRLVASDEDSRMLRALFRVVERLRAQHVVLQAHEDDVPWDMAQAMAGTAHYEMCLIAEQWSDHPDYRPEFSPSWRLETAAGSKAVRVRPRCSGQTSRFSVTEQVGARGC
ncbi:hypothetical protein [Streptomyces sp. NPDC006925]|uniref:hypothetical protein n=1 Tax=Streptomyces sp. NPDC006925 TaxID=3364768 RepID=UPI0036BAB17E